MHTNKTIWKSLWLKINNRRVLKKFYWRNNRVSANNLYFLFVTGLSRCNAKYGEYGSHGNVASELQAYANLHLERSYEYLLSSAYYNNYQTNRAGFSKLFKKLSDDAWEKTIDIIKHVTLRGMDPFFMFFSGYTTAMLRLYTGKGVRVKIIPNHWLL